MYWNGSKFKFARRQFRRYAATHQLGNHTNTILVPLLPRGKSRRRRAKAPGGRSQHPPPRRTAQGTMGTSPGKDEIHGAGGVDPVVVEQHPAVASRQVVARAVAGHLGGVQQRHAGAGQQVGRPVGEVVDARPVSGNRLPLVQPRHGGVVGGRAGNHQVRSLPHLRPSSIPRRSKRCSTRAIDAACGRRRHPQQRDLAGCLERSVIANLVERA